MSQVPVHGTLNERLQLFVTTFVKEFEAKLNFHYLLLKGELKKEDIPDSYIEKICRYVGAAAGVAGGAAGLALMSTPVFSVVESTQIGQQIGEFTGQKLNSRFNQDKRLKRATVLWPFIKLHTEDKIKFRQELIKAAWEIFQSFEHQFRYVHNNREWMKGIMELARDSVHRAINYCAEQNEVDVSNINGFISKCTVLGKSKYERSFTQLLLMVEIESTQLKWNSSSLHDKAGIVIDKDGTYYYYEKEDGTSRTTKYGYRRLLSSEKWSDMEDTYKKSPKNHFQKYKYLLVTATDEQVKEFLKEIKDEGLTEERIKEVLQEVQDSFVHEIQDLKKLFADNHDEDVQKLTDLANKLENIKIEVYLSEYRELNKQILESIDILSKKADDHQEEIKASTSKAVQEMELKLTRKIEAARIESQALRFNIKAPITLFEREELNHLIEMNQKRIMDYSYTAVITGKAGMGKTELARQYIRKYAQYHYENLIWINGGNEAEFVHSFITLAIDILKISISSKEIKVDSIVTDIYEILRRRDTLIVFDQVEDAVTYKKFLKSASSGRKLHVLITSQYKEWGEVANEKSILRLHELSQSDAKRLVKDKLKIKDESHDEDIERLVQKLKNFPLCINLATDYIRNETKCSITDYLTKFVETNLELYESESFHDWIGNDPYREVTYITLQIIIDRILRNEWYAATEILRLASYLAPQNIRIEIFLRFVREDQEKLKAAIGLLVRYSVITFNEDEERLSMNKLIQNAVREIMNERYRDNCNKITLRNVMIFHQTYPIESEEKNNIRVICEAMPHFESLFECIKSQLTKQAHELELILGTKSISYAEFLNGLGTLASAGYIYLGIERRLKQILIEILNIQDEYYSSDQTELANTLINIGLACWKLGENENHKNFVQRALTLKENRYGEYHEENLQALKSLSIAYNTLGDVENRIRTLEKVVTILQMKYDSNHPEVARLKLELSHAYGQSCQREKQKELLEELLKFYEKMNGPNDYNLTGILTDLGDVYGTLGETEKGKELLDRALIIQQKYYPDDSNEATILANLARAYGRSGDFERQKELLKRALKIQEKHYGPNHYEIVRILNNLVRAYRDAGETQEALRLFHRLESIKNQWPQMKFV